MDLVEECSRHVQQTMIKHVSGGMTARGFSSKIAEMRREIAQLQMAVNRLERAHLRNRDRGFMGPGGGDIHVVSDQVEKELVSVHGWIVSMVESIFTLIWMESGSDDARKIGQRWKSYFP
jgi:hypothetical protein